MFIFLRLIDKGRQIASTEAVVDAHEFVVGELSKYAEAERGATL